jgi:hypothetical protein
VELVQHIKDIIFGGKRNSQGENENKTTDLQKKYPALWTRASEFGHLDQIFETVSIKWGFPTYLSNNFARRLT